MTSEIPQYAFGIDNVSAAQIFNSINVALTSILLITSLIVLFVETHKKVNNIPDDLTFLDQTCWNPNS